MGFVILFGAALFVGLLVYLGWFLVGLSRAGSLREYRDAVAKRLGK